MNRFIAMNLVQFVSEKVVLDMWVQLRNALYEIDYVLMLRFKHPEHVTTYHHYS